VQPYEIANNDRFWIVMEHADGRWWIHMQVHKWSRLTLQAIRLLSDGISETMGGLWAMEPEETVPGRQKRFSKFLKLLSWTEESPEQDENGAMKRVYSKRSPKHDGE